MRIKRKIEQALRELEENEGSFLEIIGRKSHDLLDYVLDILDEIYGFFVRPLAKIARVMNFIPVLWENYDWDYAYMLALLDHKLKRMKDCFESEGIVASEDLKKMLDSIDETREHIRRYVNNSEIYEEEHPLPFKIGYRFEPSEDGKGSYMISTNEHAGRDLTEEEDKIYTDWLKAMYENENKEWGAIWDSMKAGGRSWWS